MAISLLCVSRSHSPAIQHRLTHKFSTSYVLDHSVSGTISTANAIIIAVGKPLMAKLADV